MKRFLFLVTLFASLTVHAQYSNNNNNLSEKTDIADARFEIIQSPIARKYTVKIDKETGETWLLVVNKEKKLCWEQLYKGSTSYYDTKNEGKNNYLIFMGGVAAKDMFLLNVNTGACWQLVEDLSDGSYWWSSMTSH